MATDTNRLDRFRGLFNGFEQTFIALLLGLMTLVTFASVVVRYVFNSAVGRWFEGLLGIDLPDTILWGLEVVLILFAWLVLFGIGFCVKITAHLGVDAVINLFARPGRRVVRVARRAGKRGLCATATERGLGLLGAIRGIRPHIGPLVPDRLRANPRSGVVHHRSGSHAGVSSAGWKARSIEGEEYEKLPRVIPYVILPIGVLLLVIRYVQATIGIYRGDRESLIASHEAEDAVEEAAQTAKGGG